MDYLKSIFGDKSFTYAELEAALKDNKNVKLANLASGQYVDKSKLDAKIIELDTANQTIGNLQNTVKQFDGVDVKALNQQITDLQVKYNTDTVALKLDFALTAALSDAKAKNPKAVKALLDGTKVKLDGEKLTGLDDQLEALKKSDPYLFEIETKKQEGNEFVPGGDPNKNKATNNEGKTVTEKISNKMAALFSSGE